MVSGLEIGLWISFTWEFKDVPWADLVPREEVGFWLGRCQEEIGDGPPKKDKSSRTRENCR